MRKPMYKDCEDDNGEFDSECFEEKMCDYGDAKYEEMKDRQMEDELDEFAELAGMPYSKAVQVIKTKIVTVDSYPIGDKKVSEVIKDLKDGYFSCPF